jgi:hypothetical protein
MWPCSLVTEEHEAIVIDTIDDLLKIVSDDHGEFRMDIHVHNAESLKVF